MKKSNVRQKNVFTYPVHWMSCNWTKNIWCPKNLGLPVLQDMRGTYRHTATQSIHCSLYCFSVCDEASECHPSMKDSLVLFTCVCVCVCMVWNIWWSPYCKIPEIKRIFVHVNSSNLIYICTLYHFDYHLREVSLKFYSKFDIVHGNIFICNWGIQYTSDRYCVFQLNHNVFSFLVTFTV